METFRADEAVELATLDRSGFVESRHLGSLVVLDARGSIALELGNPNAPVFGRSALKPFQATAIVAALAECDITLPDELVAIASASHTGTPTHARLVTAVLDSAGLSLDALRCPADWPGDPKAQDDLIRAGSGKSPLYMNCSGKHAGFLVACVAHGWPVESYLDPGHPMQLAVRECVETFTGEPIAWTGVDGCGAPVHALSLVALARGFRAIALAPHDASAPALSRAAAQVSRAMRAFPAVVDGPGLPDATVVEKLGLLVKCGAEGVMVMSAPTGETVALKILDGNLRAATVVALHALTKVGAVSLVDFARLLENLQLDVYGGGRPVGSIHPTF